MKILPIHLLAIISIIVVVGCAVYKHLNNSRIEDHSRTSASYSLADAQERGVQIRIVRFQPNYFNWHGQRIHIAEAWIEQISQIRYHFLFFSDREYFDEYRLVVRPNRLTDSAANSEELVSNGKSFGTQSSGIGKTYVHYFYLDRVDQFPMSVYVFDSNKNIPDTLIAN